MLSLKPLFKKILFMLFWGICFSSYQVDAQNIIYVDADNSSGVEDGTSWATAFTDIQDAFVSSLNLVGIDEIWVAEGTYTPVSCISNCETDAVRGATFQLLKEVSLLGGFKGNESDKSERNPWNNFSILSGDILGNDDLNDLRKDAPSRSDNSNHVLTGDLVDNTSVLDGFIIRGGNASSDILNTQSGGGLINNAGSPIIRNCIFEYNTATAAGALDCSNGGSPIVVNSIFRNNIASDLGGAISVFQEAKPIFLNCLFYDNEAGQTGGASYSGDNGTGATTIATFYNCTFYNNSSVDVGPTHAGQLNSSAIFMNCILWENTRNGSFSPQIKLSDSATVEVSYSIIQVDDTLAYTGTGNLRSDPDFYDKLNRDFRINASSPAVDAGGVIPLDLGDIDGDSITNEDLPFDLARNNRVQVVDAGGIDIGPYESNGILDGIFNSLGQNGLEFKILPNPTKADMIGLEISQIKGNQLNISLLDLNGRLIYAERLRVSTHELTRHRLAVSGLNKGLYLVAIKTDTQQYVRKLIIY